MKSQPKRQNPKKVLFESLRKYLSDFTIMEEGGLPNQYTREDVEVLLKEKQYTKLATEKGKEFWAKVWTTGNYSANVSKDTLDPKNKEFSLVILAEGVCTEGLVAIPTRQFRTKGLFDNGGNLSYTDLYEILKEHR